MILALQVRFIGLRVHGRRLRKPGLFPRKQPERECARDTASDVILQRQDAGQLSVKTVGPLLCLVADANQRRADTNAVVLAAQAPLEHVIHAQLAARVNDRARSVLETHRRGPRDHAQALGVEPPQLRDHLVREAVAEELLPGIASQVLKGKHRELDPCGRGRDRQPLAHAAHVGAHQQAGEAEEQSRRRQRLSAAPLRSPCDPRSECSRRNGLQLTADVAGLRITALRRLLEAALDDAVNRGGRRGWQR